MLLEIIIALAVLLILAAVAVPSIAAHARQAGARESAAQLAVVRDALYNPALGANAFFQKIGRNAGRLSELSAPIIPNNATYATGTDDSCGNAFTAFQASLWLNRGPFVNFTVDRTAGMQLPIGSAEDTLTRIPNSATTGVLRITFLSVDPDDADLMDQIVDGGNGPTAGTVRWVLPPVNGMVTMYYIVPINNRC